MQGSSDEAMPVLLSGCSGGGKSTLLAALAARGHRVVPEPGRRIVAEETERGGRALPWADLEAFLRRAVAMALADLEAMRVAGPGPVFFDRGLVDAASALRALTGDAAPFALCREHRYDTTVFLAPPWPEIFVADGDRRHGIEAALAEYERLAVDYPALGYRTVLLPRGKVAERVRFVEAAIANVA